MEHLLAFFSGFIIAGLVGWGSSLILRSWASQENQEQLEEILLVEEGCSRVVSLILLSLSLLIIISLFIFSFQYEWLLYFLLGVFFAALIGLHLQNIFYAYKRVCSVYKVLLQKLRLRLEPESLSKQSQIGPKPDEKYSSEKQRHMTTTPSTNFIQPASSFSRASNTQNNGILIVTVTKVEAQAVLQVFSQAAGQQWTRQPIGNKTYYNLGIYGGAPVFMVQSEMGTATPGGALLTIRQAVQDLRPQAVIMCGIAFGLRPDKQQLGDILVARQLLYYEPQKVDLAGGQIPRGDRTTCAERLLDRFRSGDNDWKGVPTHFGLVLSGEKLVNDPIFRDWLLKIEPEAIGGEMEGAGLYTAARDTKVDWILVKAICDWADGTKNNDAQSQAANNAAQFVLHVLQLGGWDERV